jgi:EmrB/QacA subfamily drug resistance transporter
MPAVSPPASPPSAVSPSRPSRLRWLAFSAAAAAAAMDLLDSTIAQVAAPSIRHDLGGSFAVIQWITAAYGLAMAVGLLMGGRLGDLYGRKRVLLAGLGAFCIASAACAGATGPGELIAARVLQGAAGAVMVPQVFGLIRDLFAPEEMGTAFAVYGPIMGLSAMLGPIMSGGLIGLDLAGTGWRMIFLVNLPVGAFALITGARLLPSVAPQAAERGLDLTGTVLAAAGMFMLVFPLVEGHDLGWPAWLWAMLIASAPTLTLFAVHQRGRKRAGRAPLVEPSVFRHRSYTSGLLFSLAYCGSLGGIILLFNVLLQAGLGFSPWHSAVTTAPWAAGAFVGSAVGGMQMVRYGRRVLHAGLVVEAAGLLAIFAVLQTAGARLDTVELLAPMIIGGVGMGMVSVPLFDIVMAGVAPHEMGSAASVLQSTNGLGSSLGVAGLGAAFFSIVGAGGVDRFVLAGEWIALASVALLVVSFVLGFRLPLRARELGGADGVAVAELEVVGVGA